MAEKIYWIDNDGGSLDLTDGTIYNVLQGIDGRFMPPFETITSEVYNLPGDYTRLRKTKAREIIIPIIVYGTSVSDFRTNIRMLTDAFDPIKGDGKLKVVTPDSKTFLINCHYLDGMTLPESDDTGTCSFRRFIATFLAHDPLWYNALENEKTWWGTSYLYPSKTIINNGDVDTWPLWRISGPATGAEGIWLSNWTTNKHTQIKNVSLASNYYSVYIDTRRTNTFVYKVWTLNYMTLLSSTSELWPLAPGVNVISILITGSDTTNSVTCRWVDKYYGV